MTPQKYSKIFFDEGLAGEYSTSYIQHPITPRHIFTDIPNTKLILFLRNPIDRAYSHFVMQKRGGLESFYFETILEMEFKELAGVQQLFRTCFNQDSCDINKCLKENPTTVHKHRFFHQGDNSRVLQDEKDLKSYMFTSYLGRSLYFDQVQRYLSIFPRDQILIVDSDKFYDNEQLVLDEIADFLNIPRFDYAPTGILHQTWGGGSSNTHQPHDYIEMDPTTRVLLREFFEPYNQALYELIGENFNWK